jgi:hypothetical protein
MMIWPIPDEPFHRRDPREALDVQLACRVAEALAADSRVRRQGVTIEVQNGVVMLTGAVDGPQARAAIVAAARDVSGVRDVCNALRLKDDGSAARDAEFDGTTMTTDSADAFGEIAARLASGDPEEQKGGRVSTVVLVCLLMAIIVLLAVLIGMFGWPAILIGCAVAATIVEMRRSRRRREGKRPGR